MFSLGTFVTDNQNTILCFALDFVDICIFRKLELALEGTMPPLLLLLLPITVSRCLLALTTHYELAVLVYLNLQQPQQKSVQWPRQPV